MDGGSINSFVGRSQPQFSDPSKQSVTIELTHMDDEVEESSFANAEYMEGVAEEEVDFVDDEILMDALCDDSNESDDDADMGDTSEFSFDYDEEEEYKDDELEAVNLSCASDIHNLDLNSITTNEVKSLHFANLELAYMFYNEYGKVRGFSGRKSKVRRNNKGEVVEQTFLCHRQGYREDKGVQMEDRTRLARKNFRCGCHARMCVHEDKEVGLWCVKKFMDDHNHKLLDKWHRGMLPTHRRLIAGDILQINDMRNSGMSIPQIVAAIASQCGGYRKVPFRVKDIHNLMEKQRRVEPSDSNAALKYLENLHSNDPMMFIRHTIDKEKRLEHLFWSDGTSRVNYEVFGEVLAFDATYRKNKYKRPVVIFSGINHHNKTTIFAAAFVANETEETYTWLLNCFYEAMKGKAPSSVITDGCVAMKNAIKSVFPNAHHRLCAWHLIKNAADNVKIPAFLSEFKTCMLVDLEVADFHRRWKDVVTKYDLGDNSWVNETYEKRNMWATCHIRGNFFAGIRTTSRCEALHSQMLKYVHSRINLTDFVRQFQRYLNFMRNKEVEDDFESELGQEVPQTCLRGLEKSASQRFTREVLILFRRVLVKSLVMRVTACKDIATSEVYIVTRYPKRDRQWFVSYYPLLVLFKCSCERMESYGLPCEHVIAVLVELNFEELPNSLILDRWTKSAKDSVRGRCSDGSDYWESHIMSRYSCLLELCRKLCNLGSQNEDEFNLLKEMLRAKVLCLQTKYGSEDVAKNIVGELLHGELRDPVRPKTKGSRQAYTSRLSKSKRKNKCGSCGQVGHNRKTCPHTATNGNDVHNDSTQTFEEHFEDPNDENDDLGDIDDYLMSQLVDESSNNSD